MADISWNDAVEVADAHQAMDAVSTNAYRSHILLRTPKDGLFSLGSRFWKAVGTKLIREFPNHHITIIVDAAHDAGIAMGAIADGHPAIRFTGDDETFEKLVEIGRDSDCLVIR